MDHIRTNIQGLITCTHTLKVAAKFSVESIYMSFVSATQDSIPPISSVMWDCRKIGLLIICVSISVPGPLKMAMVYQHIHGTAAPA